jgi:hypothetical protein
LTLVVGVLALLSGRKSIRPTTLVAAWWWTLAALVSWSFVELAAALSGPALNRAIVEALRFAAVGLTFCPVVALMGAKRPQHQAWNFVVLALWAMVALPAAEAFFLRGRLQIGLARSLFTWVLILLTPLNFIATRYWASALLVATGQALGFSSHLHGVGQSNGLSYVQFIGPPPLVGLMLCGLGLLIAGVLSLRARMAASSYDHLWLDFRDTFGLFWALRVQERINAAAQQYGWDLELTWSGFRGSDGARLAKINATVEPTLRTTFKGLLRRFVSSEWIAARLGSPG